MKQSEHNRMVLENFVLYITGVADDKEEKWTKEMPFSPVDLYGLVHDYIQQDHTDGKGADYSSQDDLGFFTFFHIIMNNHGRIFEDMDYKEMLAETQYMWGLYCEEEGWARGSDEEAAILKFFDARMTKRYQRVPIGTLVEIGGEDYILCRIDTEQDNLIQLVNMDTGEPLGVPMKVHPDCITVSMIESFAGMNEVVIK